MKIGVADYGMMVWYGAVYDYGMKMDALKAIGYDGAERIYANTPDEAYYRLFRCVCVYTQTHRTRRITVS